jgi:DNA mismatch endonuclease, patch repair protein
VSDRFSLQKRSDIMGRVKRKDTRPEKVVRSLLHRMGYRFRLQNKDLPGTPDIVLPKYETVIFVHGCFWHRHPGCRYASTPQSNITFWKEKFEKNVERDEKAKKALEILSWQVLIVWQCETRKIEELQSRLKHALSCKFHGICL